MHRGHLGIASRDTCCPKYIFCQPFIVVTGIVASTWISPSEIDCYFPPCGLIIWFRSMLKRRVVLGTANVITGTGEEFRTYSHSVLTRHKKVSLLFYCFCYCPWYWDDDANVFMTFPLSPVCILTHGKCFSLGLVGVLMQLKMAWHVFFILPGPFTKEKSATGLAPSSLPLPFPPFLSCSSSGVPSLVVPSLPSSLRTQ